MFNKVRVGTKFQNNLTIYLYESLIQVSHNSFLIKHLNIEKQQNWTLALKYDGFEINS